MSQVIEIIGIPIDLGQSQRGVDLGPGALRYAGLVVRLERLGFEVRDMGNLVVPVRDAVRNERDTHSRETIRAVCESAYEAGRRAVEHGHFPLFLGGMQFTEGAKVLKEFIQFCGRELDDLHEYPFN